MRQSHEIMRLSVQCYAQGPNICAQGPTILGPVPKYLGPGDPNIKKTTEIQKQKLQKSHQINFKIELLSG